MLHTNAQTRAQIYSNAESPEGQNQKNPRKIRQTKTKQVLLSHLQYLKKIQNLDYHRKSCAAAAGAAIAAPITNDVTRRIRLFKLIIDDNFTDQDCDSLLLYSIVMVRY